MRKAIAGAALLLASTALITGCDKLGQAGGSKAEVKNTAYPEQVFWGDTHLHTSNSVDAFGFGTRLDPEVALRFAKGEEVESSTGVKAKLARPLDFLVIADHSGGLGATRALYEAPRFMIKDKTLLRWHDMMHEGEDGMQRGIRIKTSSYTRHLVNSVMAHAKACGIGNSMRLLTKQAMNVTKLLLVNTPDELVREERCLEPGLCACGQPPATARTRVIPIAAAEERSDEGTGKRRLPAVGCNAGLGGVAAGAGRPLHLLGQLLR